MARTKQDARLDSRSVRAKLKQRREPYWRSISEGMALGYRKGSKGGTWIAKQYSPEKGRRYAALGTADDFADADGVHVLSFSQAQEAAREWFKRLAREDAGEVSAGPYTVADALDDYLADYTRRGGKALHEIKNRIEAFIRPALGSRMAASLTAREIRDWHDALAKEAPRLRTRRGAAKRNVRAFDPADPEAARQRRVSANRKLATLKAALNHAFAEGRVASDDAWRRTKPYPRVDRARARYLSLDEARRLVNATPPSFRPMVHAALLTGCRYAELARARVRDFDTDAGTLHITESKAGKPRHVVLTDDGSALLSQHAHGKDRGALLFARADGHGWGKSHQQRPMRDACKAAKIAPAVSFHILRHTYASHLVMRGTPLMVVGANLGHADTRMVERHYGHLAPSYIAETIRANMPALGIIEESNIVRMSARAG